jgi:diacylglycerol kinase (ATP)
VATAAVFGVLLWLKPPPLWWAVAALTIGFVLAAEIFNTAVEGLADHLHPEQHPAIKVVKDCAAGAVLVASIAALGVAAAFVYDLLLR